MKFLHKLTQSSAARPLISSDMILWLCGVLFGMCLNESLSGETRHLFLWAGVTGLLAFIGLRVVDQLKNREQKREAIEQTEQRLVRHAQLDQTSGHRA